MIINKSIKCYSVPRFKYTNQTHTKCNCVVFKTISTPRGGGSANGSLFGGGGVLQGGGVCAGLQGQCAGEKIPLPQILHRGALFEIANPKIIF